MPAAIFALFEASASVDNTQRSIQAAQEAKSCSWNSLPLKSHAKDKGWKEEILGEQFITHLPL